MFFLQFLMMFLALLALMATQGTSMPAQAPDGPLVTDCGHHASDPTTAAGSRVNSTSADAKGNSSDCPGTTAAADIPTSVVPMAAASSVGIATPTATLLHDAVSPDVAVHLSGGQMPSHHCDDDDDDDDEDHRLKGGALAGVIIGGVVFLSGILFVWVAARRAFLPPRRGSEKI
ncbi:hypothetical protein F4780DRAFT_775569 [Xylariomycetidae sp. FL0641]|nr:hypothetical protein F4780DRAFT_775569 [Xylariomycetidae sp. FL0641]